MGTVLMADLSGPFLILSKLLNEKKVKGFPVVFHSDFYIVRPAAFYHGLLILLIFMLLFSNPEETHSKYM